MPTVAALGFFDGVHQGHRAVIGRARELATLKGISCALFTFEPPVHTDRAVSKSGVRLLQSIEQREAIMRGLGVELLVCPPFESFYNLTPEEFVRIILHEAMHAVTVVCGEDYRFGQKGSGDTAVLKELAPAYGIEVVTLEPVCFDGGVVSSTRIRDCLAAGTVAEANAMLCEPYRFEGKIEAEGRTLRQELLPGMMPPKPGFYHSCLLSDGVRYPAKTEVREEDGKTVAQTEVLKDFPPFGSHPAAVLLMAEESSFLHKNN